MNRSTDEVNLIVDPECRDFLQQAYRDTRFPAKLYDIVEADKTGSIYWNAQGDGFMVNEHSFAAQYLRSNMFKTTQYASFVRQLNLYGFHKVPRHKNGGVPVSAPVGVREYRHPWFLRGRPGLLIYVRRRIAITTANGSDGTDTGRDHAAQQPKKEPRRGAEGVSEHRGKKVSRNSNHATTAKLKTDGHAKSAASELAMFVTKFQLPLQRGYLSSSTSSCTSADDLDGVGERSGFGEKNEKWTDGSAEGQDEPDDEEDICVDDENMEWTASSGQGRFMTLHSESDSQTDSLTRSGPPNYNGMDSKMAFLWHCVPTWPRAIHVTPEPPHEDDVSTAKDQEFHHFTDWYTGFEQLSSNHDRVSDSLKSCGLPVYDAQDTATSCGPNFGRLTLPTLSEEHRNSPFSDHHSDLKPGSWLPSSDPPRQLSLPNFPDSESTTNNLSPFPSYTPPQSGYYHFPVFATNRAAFAPSTPIWGAGIKAENSPDGYRYFEVGPHRFYR